MSRHWHFNALKITWQQSFGLLLLGNGWDKGIWRQTKHPFWQWRRNEFKIKSVWKESASSLVEIRKFMKKFPGRLCAVKKCNGSSIKMHFGLYISIFFNTSFVKVFIISMMYRFWLVWICFIVYTIHFFSRR